MTCDKIRRNKFKFSSAKEMLPSVRIVPGKSAAIYNSSYAFVSLSPPRVCSCAIFGFADRTRHLTSFSF